MYRTVYNMPILRFISLHFELESRKTKSKLNIAKYSIVKFCHHEADWWDNDFSTISVQQTLDMIISLSLSLQLDVLLKM